MKRKQLFYEGKTCNVPDVSCKVLSIINSYQDPWHFQGQALGSCKTYI